MQVAIVILNFNGQDLLAECLPSVLRAAEASRARCDVLVIDNESTDASRAVLAEQFPSVRVIASANRGLCSYNDVLAGRNAALPGGTFPYDVALLLNNDIKLHEAAIDPLVAPFVAAQRTANASQPPVFLTAPLCWQFDETTCEGFKTSVRWRFGLVQATGRYSGHLQVAHLPGETACAGAALAVDCRLFRELGGFDPRYLPGRLEDLDLAYRAWQRGWQLLYVPQAVAWHKGQVSFVRKFGAAGCDRLALRNTLLFQWKHLRHPLHVAQQLTGGALRIARDLVTAPLFPTGERLVYLRAVREALAVLRRLPREDRDAGRAQAESHSWRRERAFFRRFHPRTLLAERQAGQGVTETVIRQMPQADKRTPDPRTTRLRPPTPTAGGAA